MTGNANSGKVVNARKRIVPLDQYLQAVRTTVKPLVMIQDGKSEFTRYYHTSFELVPFATETGIYKGSGHRDPDKQEFGEKGLQLANALLPGGKIPGAKYPRISRYQLTIQRTPAMDFGTIEEHLFPLLAEIYGKFEVGTMEPTD